MAFWGAMIGPSQELVRAAAVCGQVSGRPRSRPLREPGSAGQGRLSVQPSHRWSIAV